MSHFHLIRIRIRIKPNSSPVYINTQSNHPPNIIKRIPSMISERISKISSNKEVFDRAAPFYNNALYTSGYKSNISYQEPQTNRTTNTARSRPRNIIWFNPPYSMNVKTNVAKKFLTLLDKCFPKSHKFHKLFNRNNVKVSYSCLPNISNIISSHNRKVLSNTNENQNQDPKCNCRVKDNCPLNGKCLDSQLIYSCNVRTTTSDEGTHYIGLTENTFKERWNQHKNSFKHGGKANSTELSKYVWELKKKGTTPII